MFDNMWDREEEGEEGSACKVTTGQGIAGQVRAGMMKGLEEGCVLA